MMKLWWIIPVLAALALSCGGGGDSAGRSAGDDDTGADDDAAIDDDGVDDDADDTDDDGGDDDTQPAPPPELAIACTDSKLGVYDTPDDLPPFDDSRRGVVVRCHVAETADANEVAERLSGSPGVTVNSGYRAYLLAYRTERSDGVAGVGTARMLLPTNPRPGPLPIVTANHGTAGLADFCALSLYEESNDDLVLPWVAAGYVVIAPDYAGLGNEGTQGYGDNADTAHSIFDAARAVLHAVTPGSVDGRFIAAGHSQGGGASQAVRAFEPVYAAPDLTLTAVVSFAGEYYFQSGLDAFRYPWLPISGGEGVTRAVMALGLYADFANLFGNGRAGEPIHPDVRDTVVDAIETLCIYPLVAALALPTADYTPPATLGEMADPDFAGEIVACLDDQPGCSERARDYADRAENNDMPMTATGAPVLMIAGMDDLQQTPASQACNRDQLEEWGVDVSVCAFDGLDHQTLVPNTAAYAVAWAFDHTNPCPSSAALPDCSGLW